MLQQYLFPRVIEAAVTVGQKPTSAPYTKETRVIPVMNRHPSSATYPKEVIIWLHPRMPLDTTEAASVPVFRLIISIALRKKMVRYAYTYLDLGQKKTYRCIDNCRYIDREEKP